MTHHYSADSVVVSRKLGSRVVRVVIPLTGYAWPHVVPSEKMLEAYR